MPTIYHKFHRDVTAIVGSYEVEFDENGKGEIEDEVYVASLLSDFPGVFFLSDPSEPEAEASVNSGGNDMGEEKKQARRGRR